MANPVIQSSASTTGVTTSTITISKPSGLLEGDLMICVLANHATQVFSKAGWSGLNGSPKTPNLAVLYKEADSSDEAASNFVFTVSSSGFISSGILFRVTGATDASVSVQTDFDQNNGVGSVITEDASLTPQTSEDIYIIGLAVSGLDPGQSVSGYNKSSPDSTWTEQIDDNSKVGSAELGIAVATADGSDTTEVTSYGAVYSGSITGVPVTGVFVTVSPSASFTSTPSSIPLNGIVPDPSPSADVNPLPPDSIPLFVSVPNPTTRNNNRIWTDQERPATPTWTDQEKPNSD